MCVWVEDGGAWGVWPNVPKAFPAVMGQAQFGPTGVGVGSGFGRINSDLQELSSRDSVSAAGGVLAGAFYLGAQLDAGLYGAATGCGVDEAATRVTGSDAPL